MTPAGPPLLCLEGAIQWTKGVLTFGSPQEIACSYVSTMHHPKVFDLHQRTFPCNQDRTAEAQDGQETKTSLQHSFFALSCKSNFISSVSGVCRNHTQLNIAVLSRGVCHCTQGLQVKEKQARRAKYRS
jgi:hypothetical protein